MKVLLYFFLLLSAPMMLGAQTLPSDTGASARQPLNLSARMPLAPVTDTTVILRTPESGTGAALPYGAGFESRQQGSSAGSGNIGASGSSGSGGSSGNGGVGRGGAGRGR